MEFIQLSPIIACLAFILSLYYLWQRKIHGSNSKKGKLPPEPSGALPIVGHLHLLRGKDSMARALGDWADKIGPIFTVRLGGQCALLISSKEAVKECFTTNDRAFATRPISSTGKYLAYNFAAFGFAPYGAYWREMRKIVLLEVLSAKRLEAVRQLRVSEIQESMKELYSAVVKNNNTDHTNPAKVVLSKWFQQLALNISVKTLAGKRYINSVDGEDDEEGKNFRRLVKEFMHAAGEILVSDIQIPIPFLKSIDFSGRIKSMKRISKELDTIIQSWVDEHAERRLKNDQDRKNQDFIDVLLSVIDDKHGYKRQTIIKATVVNIIVAGSDSSAIVLIWIMSLLLNNRHAMKRAQEEIDNKVGRQRWVEEVDLENLSYLQAIVKETLRLYPPGPLSPTHQTMEDCNVGGYFIPKGTNLMVNVLKLHRDPSLWKEPDEFQPDRFLTTNGEIDVYGHNFEFIPFGSGRRSCPGVGHAMKVVPLVIARLLQGFDFSTPFDLPVDMKAGQGLTLPKVNPLEVLMTPRLPTLFSNN